MYSRALACIVLNTTILATVTAGCNFPPDHPSFSLNQIANDVRRAQDMFFYVYIDRFENCSGCVTELNLCYVDSHEPVLTVVIINDSNTIIHIYNITVSTDGESYQISCSPNGVQGYYGVFCCVTQKLVAAEQFEVQSNFYYGLRTYSTNSSLAHFNEYTTGYFSHVSNFGEEIAVGYTIPYSTSLVKKPFFYFRITPGSCPPVPPSPVPTQTTSVPSTSSPSCSVSGGDTACGSSPQPVGNSSHSAAANAPIPVVIGVSISAGVLILVALLLVLLGSAVRMKTKARKPRGAANSKHLRTKETTGASVNIVDEPNTSRETDSCVSNEAYGLSISPSHSETHEAPQYGQQTEDDDGYVVSQLDYTNPKTLASAANAIPTTSNVAYGIYSIPTTSNEAYGALGCQHEQQTASQADYAEVSDPPTSNTLSSEASTIPTTSNVAYGLHGISTAHNEAYGALGHQCEQQTASQADYAEVSDPPSSNTSSSVANTISTVSNVAYGLHGISITHNEAYVALGHQHEQQTASQMDYAGPPNSNTSSSAASTIPTSSNVAYSPCSIPTTHNEAYGALGCQHEQQRETDDTDECVANQYLELDADDIWNSVMHAIATELHS